MIVKVCQFKARREQGERLVEIFQPGEMEKAAEFFSMGKTAAPMLPQVQAYLDKLKPDSQRIYVLVNALGAGEFWGSNINGDYFPEASLIHKGPVYGYETFYGAFPYKHHVNKDPSKAFGKVELAAWNDAMKRVELVVMIDRKRAEMFGATDVCDKLDHGLFPDVSMGCKVPYDLCSKCLDWKKYRQAQATFDPSRHRSVGVAVLEFHKKNPIRGLSVTRNDYCEHLKGMLNKILADGTKIYAINDYPRFFDISFVFIGADKTAKVMAKLAMAHTGGRKYVTIPSWLVAEEMGYEQPSTEKSFEKAAAVPSLWSTSHPGRKKVREVWSELLTGKRIASLHSGSQGKEKRSAIDIVRDRLREKKASQRKGAEIIKDVKPSQFGSKAVPLEDNRPDLPDEVLDQLGKGDLSEALSTPTTMGMILKPREFQRITIIRLGKKPLADQLDRDGEVIPPTDESDTSIPLGSGHFSSMLKRLLLPMMEDRSMLEPIARRRVVRITICGAPKADDGEGKEAEETPFLQKISAAYNGYLDRIGDCLVDAGAIVDADPDLWETVHRSGLADGFEKTAAGVNPAVVLGAVGGAFALSRWAAHQQRRAMMGARGPTGALINLAAENPKTLMVMAGMGALHQQGSQIPRRLVRGVVDAVKGGGASLKEGLKQGVGQLL
jgi:hypothetical protein